MLRIYTIYWTNYSIGSNFNYEHNIAPITWFGILLTLIIIQYIENIVSPIIRGKILKINPLVIIFAITVGAKLGGILGIFIAIPLSTILVTFFKDLSCLKSPDEP